MNRILLSLVTAQIMFAQASAPDEARRQGILERMKDAALNYGSRLQDFLCVEVVKRSTDAGIVKHMHPLDTQEREVTYLNHKERYRDLTVNGKPASPTNQIKPGYFLGGSEFGEALNYIFAPKNAAKFEWDHVENSSTQRLCVFRYRVTTKDSTMVEFANGATIVLQHHGAVSADCESGMPLRIQLETEPATLAQNSSRIAIGLKLEVQYAMTDIGGKQFLLPQSADELSRFGGTRVRVAIQFRDYRKYEASSAVTFDTEK